MASPNVIELHDDNFDREVLNAAEPVLVDFTAVWCAPCRMIAPHIDALADAYVGRARIGKLDVEEARQVTERYGVRAMPTLLVFRRGEVVGQLVGAAPRAKIEALLTRALEA